MVMRFAAVQMSSQADRGANLRRAAELCRRAAEQGAHAVLLPENFAFLGNEQDKRAIAETLDDTNPGPILATLLEQASTNRLWVLGGGMPERSGDPDRPYNSCVVVSPQGRLSSVYRKIHLFDVELGDGAEYRESKATTAGSAPVLAEIGELSVGLSVCYDLRFPELYRALSALGAQLLVVPAAFTLATGKDHWHVLLRARAIEAQAYVVAAAQWGKHGARLTYGKSCVIDPWGEVVAQVSEGEGVVVASIDPNYLTKVREKLPALTHRVL
jgi:predicted amidohydrolase